MDTISIRYENVADLEFMGKVLKEKRSKLIRELLFEGRKMRAVELYRQKKVSIGLGAKFAGVSLSEFLDLLGRYNVGLNLDLEDAKMAMKNANEVM